MAYFCFDDPTDSDMSDSVENDELRSQHGIKPISISILLRMHIMEKMVLQPERLWAFQNFRLTVSRNDYLQQVLGSSCMTKAFLPATGSDLIPNLPEDSAASDSMATDWVEFLGH
jgi:hypothetical protein